MTPLIEEQAALVGALDEHALRLGQQDITHKKLF
jgi:hypothetical protein